MTAFFKLTCSLVILFSSGFSMLPLPVENGGFMGSRFRESETTTHKYYVSVSNVKYSFKAKALQMTTRFFIDDLQEVLNARNVEQVELGVVDEISDHYPAIQQYLDLKLVTKVDGKSTAATLLGAEYEGDQIVLYIEFSPTEVPQNVRMEFNAFYELFEEQKNLIHFKIKDERKTMILERGKPTDYVKF